MGQEATELVKGLIQGGKVRLEFDVQKRDKYGRLLAYVSKEFPVKWKSYIKGLARLPYYCSGVNDFKNCDGQVCLDLNTAIIGCGYAQPMTIPPNVKYAELFEKLYQDARENNRGLWAE